MLELLEMVGKQRLETVFDSSVNSVALDDRVSQRVPTAAHAHCMLSCTLHAAVLTRSWGSTVIPLRNERKQLFAKEICVGYGRPRRTWTGLELGMA